MLNDKIILDERLSCAAELVPDGSILLDVGTDHGYLPVQLLLSGRVSYAGASDVNSDPLSKAVRTADRFGVTDRMSFYLSDGLADIPDLERYTAVSICGMGGELIARIISESEYLRQESIPLVLQPMSSAEDLSVYLAESGFEITDERIAFAADKVYRIILARYSGTKAVLTPVEHLIGKINIAKGVFQENFPILLRKNILKFQRIIKGKSIGGLDLSADFEMLYELCAIARSEGIEYENI